MSEMTFLPAFITNAQPTKLLGIPGCCQTEYPYHLCDSCRAATGIQPGVFTHNKDDDKPLRLPTINWAQPPEQHIDAPPASWGSPIDAPGIARPFVTNNAAPKEDGPLRLPYVNWNQPVQ